MPQNKFAQGRYKLINTLLKKHRYVKSSTIVEMCRTRIGYSVSIRTIQLDIEAMRHDPLLGYFAPIEYCHRRKAFYYSDTDYTLSPFCFRKEELTLLEEVLLICRKQRLEQHCERLQLLIRKVQLYIH